MTPGDIAFIIVMGVSGSGKTTVSELLAERLGWTFEDADRLHPPDNIAKMRAGKPLSDDDRGPWLAAIAAWMDEARAAGTRAVIACSALKRAYRAMLVREAGDVRLVYLKGSAEVIAPRMTKRPGHFMPLSLLATQFQALEEPADDEHPIVVSIEAMPAEIVEAIVKALEVTPP